MNPRIHGLYVITADSPGGSQELLRRSEAALRGGARLLQYRDKSADGARRRREAAALRDLCRDFDALFIVNDDLALAAAVGAPGVHLGRDDPALDRARALLGDEAIIGVSCYDDFERARSAVQAGADYLAFGSFFPSATKPQAARAPLALLTQARSLGRPLVAIGGIDAVNAPQLIGAGADALAVISSVFLAADPEAAARALARLFA